MRRAIKDTVDKMRDLFDRWSRRSALESAWNKGDFPGGFPAQWEYGGASFAESIATYFACVRIIAGALATVPLELVQEDENGKKKYLIDEPEYWVICDYPNDETTCAEFMESTVSSLLSHGNGYHYTPRDGKGRPKEAWNLENDRCEPHRFREELFYNVSRTDGVETPYKLYQGYDMWHVKRFNYGDGLKGLSVLQAHKPLLEIARAQRDYTLGLYRNGMNFKGVVNTDEDLESKEIERIEKRLEKKYQGALKSGRPLVLAHGLKFDKVSMTPEDAQMIENFNLTERDICKIFGVPPHMVANLDRATFSNISHQQAEFVTNTLRSWAVFIEKSARHHVLNQQQRNKGWRYRFEFDELTRGIMEERFQAWNVGIQAGFVSPNEARIAEGYEPREGLDEPRQPMNMQSAAEKASSLDPQMKGQMKDNGTAQQDPKQIAKDAAKKALKKAGQRTEAEEALIGMVADAAQRSATKIAGIKERSTLDETRAVATAQNELFKVALPAARAFGVDAEEEVRQWSEDWAAVLVYKPSTQIVERVRRSFISDFVDREVEENA